MSMSVDSSTAAHVSQALQQQGGHERREKVENDNDGDDGRSVKAAQTANPQANAIPQAQQQHLREDNKGHNVDCYA
jgi:hypothetical protein